MSNEPPPDGIEAVRPVDFGKSGPAIGNGPPVARPPAGLAAELLARYLVGRVLAARLSVALWTVGVALLVAAMLIWITPVHWLSVLVVIAAVMVLAARALAMAVLRRILAVGRLARVEVQVNRLVADTGGDLRRELRRIGLPGSVFGMPLLVARIVGRRRRETLLKLTQFRVANVVPPARRSELEFLVRTTRRRTPATERSRKRVVPSA